MHGDVVTGRGGGSKDTFVPAYRWLHVSECNEYVPLSLEPFPKGPTHRRRKGWAVDYHDGPYGVQEFFAVLCGDSPAESPADFDFEYEQQTAWFEMQVAATVADGLTQGEHHYLADNGNSGSLHWELLELAPFEDAEQLARQRELLAEMNKGSTPCRFIAAVGTLQCTVTYPVDRP